MAPTGMFQPPSARHAPYVEHEEDDWSLRKKVESNRGQTKKKSVLIVEGRCNSDKWSYGLLSAGDGSCSGCAVPYCFPFVSLAETSYWTWGELAAYLSAFYFGMLAITCVITSVLFGKYSHHQFQTSQYETYYDEFYHRYFQKWVISESSRTTFTCLLVALITGGLYLLSLALFRFFLRRKLRIRGWFCVDALQSLFCSCCVVAQMHAHVKRMQPEKRDSSTLPAFSPGAYA